MGVPEEPVRATAAFEFAPEDFPIVIEYLHAGEVILTSLLTGPGTLHVPSKSELGVDGKVDVRVTTAREESYTQV